MPKKLSPSLILPIIFRYLVKQGYTKAAYAMQQQSNKDLSELALPIHRKKLTAILKSYVKANPKLLVKVVEEDSDDSSEEEEEEVVVSKKNKKKVIQQESEEEDESEEEKPKKSVLKKRKKSKKKQLVVDGIEEEEDIKIPLKKKKKTKTVTKTTTVQKKTQDFPKKPLQQGRVSFNRIDESYYRNKIQITSNSFEARVGFGHDDEQGLNGYNLLGGMRGKDFRKQKNKLKNKAEGTGKIPTTSMSIKLR